MIRCQDVPEALADLLTGEIDPGSRRRIEEHLRVCPACAAQAADAAAILGALGGEEVPDPGTGYWEAFGPRLRARIALAGKRRRRAAIACVAATIAVVSGIALAMLRGPGSRGPLSAPGRSPEAARIAAGAQDEAERRLDDLLARALAAQEGRRNLQAVLDEMAPEDPTEMDESLGSLSPEERQRLTRELPGT